MKSKIHQLFEHKRNAHVLFPYKDAESYIERVLAFIEDGLGSGDHMLLIENERISAALNRKLRARYSADQMARIHFINSLNFYMSSGSYHPPSIHAYFTKTVAPFLEQGQAFRSWAHVEWESMTEPLFLIEDFERIVDNAVDEFSFPLICAYSKNKMPDHLRTMLMETHPYILMEDDFMLSNEYRKIDVGQ